MFSWRKIVFPNCLPNSFKQSFLEKALLPKLFQYKISYETYLKEMFIIQKMQNHIFVSPNDNVILLLWCQTKRTSTE